MLRISGDTFRALQVFDGDTKSKKSLFDMYSHSLSTLAGRRLLKSWFLRPSTDVDFINARLDNVEFFMAKNDLRSDIRKILNNAGCDIDSLLLKLKRRTAVNDWRQLEKFVGGLLAIRECLLQSEANLITSKALELIVADDLREIGSCISEIVCISDSPNMY
jgi:DNA mismatch repair ATPase MutS